MAMRDDDKLVRQLSLLAFLMSQQRPVTADEIHEAVEGYGGMTEQAFLRRFYADRSEIEAMGLRLAVERPGDDPFQGDLYALPPENYYLPELDFDQAELSALQTCLYLLEGQFAYAEPLRLALQHLTLGRPSPLDDHAARTVSVNLLGGDYSPEVAAHLTKIESAISRRKTIRFTYYSIGRDERSDREVDPYSLLYSAGSWYVVGFSHERNATRIFRLSRIEGRITFKTRAEHDFPAPQDFDLSRYRDRAPWQLEGDEQTATIALTPTIAWWVEQMFGAYGTTAIGADGSGVYTTSFNNRRELVAWILGLGAEAQVIEPPELRAAVVAALELVGERHQVDGGAPTPLTPAPAAAAPEIVAPAPAAATAPAAGGQGASERVVPAERFARLLALMTRLLAACGDSAEAHIPIAELRASLNLDRKVLEDDIGLLNLINFGGGCYALYAQIEGDTVAVQKETYGDRFARPARLSPLEAKALLWALDFIGDRLPIEAGGSLSSVRAKVEAAMGGEAPAHGRARARPGRQLGRRGGGQPRDPRGPAAGDRLLDRVARRDHQAHDRAAPARQRPGRLVRGGLLPPRRGAAHLPPRPHPQRRAAGGALHAPRRDRDVGPVHALGRPPAAGRDRGSERLGVVQPGPRPLDAGEAPLARAFRRRLRAGRDPLRERGLAREGTAQVPGRRRAVRAGRPAPHGRRTGRAGARRLRGRPQDDRPRLRVGPGGGLALAAPVGDQGDDGEGRGGKGERQRPRRHLGRHVVGAVVRRRVLLARDDAVADPDHRARAQQRRDARQRRMPRGAPVWRRIIADLISFAAFAR